MTLDVRQTLHDHFPDQGDTLHALKVNNAHFRHLADRFDAVCKQVYKIETDIEPASDERLEELKKERLAVLDEVAAMLARERQSA